MGISIPGGIYHQDILLLLITLSPHCNQLRSNGIFKFPQVQTPYQQEVHW